VSVALVAGVAWAILFPSRCYEGVIEAYLRHDLETLAQIVIGLVRASALIVVLTSGGGILALTAVVSLAMVTRAVVVVVIARRIHGEFAWRARMSIARLLEKWRSMESSRLPLACLTL
jgi:uncharacterized membrane protein